MDSPWMSLLLLLVGMTISGAGAWFAGKRWYGRQITELQAKLEKHRQVSGNHISQHRKQIAHLQDQLKTVERLQDEVQRLREREQARVRQTLDEITRDADRDPRPHGQAVSPTGFADTVPVADVEPVPRKRTTERT